MLLVSGILAGFKGKLRGKLVPGFWDEVRFRLELGNGKDRLVRFIVELTL